MDKESEKLKILIGRRPVGFDRGIALTLASSRCDIVANDIDQEGAERTAAEEGLQRNYERVSARLCKGQPYFQDRFELFEAKGGE